MISFSLRDLARVWANSRLKPWLMDLSPTDTLPPKASFRAFCVRLPFPHTELCRLRSANNYRMRTYVLYLLVSSDDVTTDNRVLRMMWRTLLIINHALLFWLLTCRGLNKHLNRDQ